LPSLWVGVGAAIEAENKQPVRAIYAETLCISTLRSQQKA
jgi:hypothetical protein